MKKLLALLILAALPVFAADEFAETMTLNSGSAFVSTKSYTKHLSLSCDGAVAYRVCDTSTCAAVTTDAKLQNFDLPVDICVGNSQYISLIRTGGATVTCAVSKVFPFTPPCK